MKKKVFVMIEKNEDGFHAHSTNVPAVNGYGGTVEECKKNVFEGIEVARTTGGKYNFNYKEGEYEVVFNFDIESLMENYKGVLTNAGFEKLTGINQRQMYQYAAGLKKPRAAQRKKITKGIHELANELLAIEL
jgi:predicted RNase H-like HicB family nuclease